MCIAVWTEDGPLSTLGELRAAGLAITPDDHYPDDEDDSCLCGVDVEAILERSNVSYKLDDIMGEPTIIGPLPTRGENDG